MKQKSSQMRFAPWPVVQAALALALSGLLLARPQAAAQSSAAAAYCPRCSHCLWCAACWGRWHRRWGGRCGL